jgi:putative ABC transport system permease protein
MRDWKEFVRDHLPPLGLSGAREQEIVDELAQQLEDAYSEAISRGLTPSEAELRATTEISDWSALAQEIRRAERPVANEVEIHLPWKWREELRQGNFRRRKIGTIFAELFQDLKYSERMLRKSPGFTAIAVLTLALGMGVNTAIFSVVDTVLLHPLPYHQPQNLVLITEVLPQLGVAAVGVSPGEYLDYRAQNKSLEQVAAYELNGFNLTGEGIPVRVNGASISAGTFSFLGVQPILGQTFSAIQDKRGAASSVIISHSLWMQRFGGSPEALGKTIRLDEQSYTIIGVMPASFRYPTDGAPASERADVWVPLGFAPDRIKDRVRDFGVGVVGRMKSGVTLAQAKQDVASVAEAFMRSYPELYAGTTRVVPQVLPFTTYSVAKARPLVMLLSVAVACVLLIACANITNLLLARANLRKREMAIRGAIGATRIRLLRQCFTESVVVSLLGGACGIAVSGVTLNALRRFGPATLPRLQDASLHPLAIWFTFGLALLTTLLFGAVPALKLSQAAPQDALKETTQIGAARRTRFTQDAIVCAEFALAFVLVVSGLLLVRSFVRLLNVPLGFNPDRAVVVRTIFDQARYADPAKRRAAQTEALQRLEQLPGVASVTAASHLPLGQPRQIGFRLETAGPADFHWAENSLVAPRYFRTMGISILRGREFSADDNERAPFAAVVSAALARQYFPNENPIGQRFLWGGRAAFTIIGIAADVRISSLDSDPPPMIYNSMFQVESGASSRTAFVMRVQGGASDDIQNLIRESRAQIWSVDKELPVYDASTLDSLVSESASQRRFTTQLMAAFTALAVILAAIGLFGVMSCRVDEKTRELALRMALGASPAQILGLVLRGAAILGLIGCAAGLALSFLSARFLLPSLFQTEPMDPYVLGVSLFVLLCVTFAASYGPARLAMRTDPMVALRYE